MTRALAVAAPGLLTGPGGPFGGGAVAGAAVRPVRATPRNMLGRRQAVEAGGAPTAPPIMGAVQEREVMADAG
jgi:hypothetical protein